MARMRIVQSGLGGTVFMQKSALPFMLPQTVIRLVDSFSQGAESSVTAFSRSFYHAGAARGIAFHSTNQPALFESSCGQSLRETAARDRARR